MTNENKKQQNMKKLKQQKGHLNGPNAQKKRDTWEEEVKIWI